MRLFYFVSGVFANWLIQTKEGHKFAKACMSKGLELARNVLPEAKRIVSNGVDGTIFPDSGHSGDNKHNVKS